MPYQSTRALFYQMKGDAWEDAYRRRINGDSVIRPEFAIHDDPAFFVVTGDMLRSVGEIYRESARIQTLQDQLPQVAVRQYMRDLMIDEIHHTNELENVQSTRREIRDSLDRIENPAASGSDFRFLGMAGKYRRLCAGETVPLRTTSDVRRLYDELIAEEVLRENADDAPDGMIFRKGGVHVLSSSGKIIHTGVFPEQSIIAAMDQALNFLNDAAHEPLIRIAAFHYLFGYIHPFYNGNGRTSRFISSYLLSENMNLLIALRLSGTVKEHYGEYKRIFRDANDPRNRGDMTDFISVFLGFVRESAHDVHATLTERKRLLEHIYRLLDNHRVVSGNSAVLRVLIQNALFAEDGLDIQEILKLSDRSRASADHELKQYIEKWRVVTCEKRGRKNIYRLDYDALLKYLSENLIAAES